MSAFKVICFVHDSPAAAFWWASLEHWWGNFHTGEAHVSPVKQLKMPQHEETPSP